MLSQLLPLVLSSALDVGAVAPDFTAVDTEGRTHRLSELVKNKTVVLAFFPKAFTPGCTKEMQAYTAEAGALKSKDAILLAVSTDDEQAMKRFKASLKSEHHFIPDPDGKLVRLFDVRMPVIGLATRKTFVIGGERKILSVQSGSDAVDPSAAIAACPASKSLDAKVP